jgi:hypothetical protein
MSRAARRARSLVHAWTRHATPALQAHAYYRAAIIKGAQIMPATAATHAAATLGTTTAVQAGVNAALAAATTATFTSAAARYMAVPAQITFEYGIALVKDIPADRLAHMPHPTMNHAAFNIGHLAIYPNRILMLLGRNDLIVDNPRYTELFAAGKPCVEQDGRYPDKGEIVHEYIAGYRKALEILPTVTDELLAKPNPIEGRMRERFPLVGIAVNFLLNNHHMSHLGQVSAWRRAIGLGSVM